MIHDIWTKEVIKQNNTYYLVSGPITQRSNRLLINPSYLAPYNYKLFAKIDPAHNWNQLASDSYTLLAKIQSNSKAGLISNWVTVEANGDITSASDIIPENADTYGYDAFRVNWRMAEDSNDSRARDILIKFVNFYQSEWDKNHIIFSEYDMTGKPLTNFSDIPTSAGAIIGLHALNQNLSYDIYKTDLISRFNAKGLYWGQMTNYYSQNWAAFAVQYLGIGGHDTKGTTLPKK